jgi:hypothetical protein
MRMRTAQPSALGTLAARHAVSGAVQVLNGLATELFKIDLIAIASHASQAYTLAVCQVFGCERCRSQGQGGLQL